MNDTDRLIAAIFAASMTVRSTEPKLADFFGHFEACIGGLMDREEIVAAAKVVRTAAEHKKAWGE